MSNPKGMPRKPSSVQLQVITPTIAKNWLAKMGKNRTVRGRDVDRYAQDMLDGNWEINGCTIVLDFDGRVIDGQHRLLACIKAGVSFSSYVAKGLDPSVMHSIDVGPTRTQSDNLNLLGYKYPNALAAATRVLHQIAEAQPVQSKGYGWRCTKIMGSRTVLVDYIKAHPGLVTSINFCVGYQTHINGWFTMSVLAATHAYLSGVHDAEWADEFIESFATGAMLEKASPIYKVRERLRRDSTKVGFKATAKYRITCIIRAWNFFITDTPIRKFVPGSGNMDIPKVVGEGEKIALQYHARRSVAKSTAKAKRANTKRQSGK
jgi:hypothetical protein